MTVAAIRERLYDYIRLADDKKIKAIYTMLEDQIIAPVDWEQDEDFVRELNDRVKKYEDGRNRRFHFQRLVINLKNQNLSALQVQPNELFC